jgi:DNA-binding transcriptional ArsR family regulator
MDDASNVSAELQAAMVKAMLHPLRGRILTAICERPQLTVRQLSARIDEPPRRIRRQLQALIDSGLVMVDHETSRRNARERHYRSAVRRISIGDEDLATVEDGRAAATTVLRVLVDDIRGAIGDLTFGTHEGHAEVRIPGWVDERGWNELAALFWRAMEEIEATMVESARRLRDGDGPGI